MADAHPFLPVQLAAFETHQALGHAEGLAEEGQQMGVGLALHRRCGEADLQALAVQPGELVAARLGLQVAIEEQVLAVPAVEAQRKMLNCWGMPVMAARLLITSMSISFSARNAKIGERSSPPRFGRSLRNGISSGSQIWFTSCAPGL